MKKKNTAKHRFIRKLTREEAETLQQLDAASGLLSTIPPDPESMNHYSITEEEEKELLLCAERDGRTKGLSEFWTEIKRHGGLF